MLEPAEAAESWLGSRGMLLGRLTGATQREAERLLRQQGAIVTDSLLGPLDWIILGELPHGRTDWTGQLNDSLRQAIQQGETQVLDEAEFWRRLRSADAEPCIARHFTPGMLAALVGVTTGCLRCWRRQGLLPAQREVHRLAYFDFEAVITARRLKELTAAGIATKTIHSGLQRLARWLPHVNRPLAELSFVPRAGELLLRWGEALVDLDGQHRFDFEQPASPELRVIGVAEAEPMSPVTAQDWLDMAAELDEAGDLTGAIEACRAALVCAGPSAEANFQLAELLYRATELSAARERYSMAVELDENFVEARANLGCVLAELRQTELAIAAFEGTLAFHEAYPDVHYHLAQVLDEVGRHTEAELHWTRFAALAPDSPWAEIARRRLASISTHETASGP